MIEINFWGHSFNIIYLIIICWSGEVELGSGDGTSFHKKNILGVAGPFFESMCLGEHNIRRDCIGGYSRYSTSGLLLTLLILRIIINLIMEFDDGNWWWKFKRFYSWENIHEKTKILPGCHAKLKVSSDDKTVYCIVCKYWTKLWPIKRRDSIFWDWIMIFCFNKPYRQLA